MTNDYTNMGSAQTVSNSGHLVDYEFLPAVIVETDDPLHYGRIKVSALGAYNANNSTTEQLPWCYPFTMQGNNSYASYEKGSKVWLLRNKKRQDENWFFPMYELHDSSQAFVNSNAGNKPEIISMRNNGASNSSITYDHKGGYNMSTGGVGGGASVNVGTNSTTTISGGTSSVKVTDEKVYIGSASGDGSEPAVLGNRLKDFLIKLSEILQTFAQSLSEQDMYAGTAPIDLYKSISDLFSLEKIEKLLSEHVMINEGAESSNQEDTQNSNNANSADQANTGNSTSNNTSGNSSQTVTDNTAEQTPATILHPWDKGYYDQQQQYTSVDPMTEFYNRMAENAPQYNGPTIQEMTGKYSFNEKTGTLNVNNSAVGSGDSHNAEFRQG